MKSLKSKTLTCYGCIYFTNSEKCNWFYHNNKGNSRLIPHDVKNMGCKKRKGIIEYGNQFVEYIINKFEGEIV